MLRGVWSSAFLAGPPSPLYPGVLASLPAKVVMIPLVPTTRIVILPVGDVERPVRAHDHLSYSPSFACAAGTFSPVEPHAPVPATVEMRPAGLTFARPRSTESTR